MKQVDTLFVNVRFNNKILPFIIMFHIHTNELHIAEQKNDRRELKHNDNVFI